MDKELSRQVGARIRAQRELLNIPREKLSNYVNISPQFLSEVERGIKGLSAETLRKLCEGLKLSADFVLMGRERPSDVSEIAATLSMLDENYLPLAEDLLKTFVKTVSLKKEQK
jgi:transcriptional regulator with XRE-family HTH domain